MSVLPTTEELDKMERIAKLLAKSGYYGQNLTTEQAFARILQGWGLNLTPAESMTSIIVLYGKLAMSANLISLLIKRAGYDWIMVLDDTKCELTITRNGVTLGKSTFTMRDAEKAGLNDNNWKRFPRNMMFARAISNAAKWYCPDAFGGGAVYTPDELGAEIDDEGNAVETHAKPKSTRPQSPAIDTTITPDDIASAQELVADESPTPTLPPLLDEHGEFVDVDENGNPVLDEPANVRPFELPPTGTAPAKPDESLASEGMVKQIGMKSNEYGKLMGWDAQTTNDYRHDCIQIMTGGDKDSAKKLTVAEAERFITLLIADIAGKKANNGNWGKVKNALVAEVSGETVADLYELSKEQGLQLARLVAQRGARAS